MAEIAIRSDFDKEIDIRNINIVQYIKEYINIYDGTFESKKIKKISPIIKQKRKLRIDIL